MLLVLLVSGFSLGSFGFSSFFTVVSLGGSFFSSFLVTGYLLSSNFSVAGCCVFTGVVGYFLSDFYHRVKQSYLPCLIKNLKIIFR